MVSGRTLGSLVISALTLLTGSSVMAQDKCGKNQFKIDKKCYDIGKQCSNYDGKGDKVCNNDKDQLQCDWKKSDSKCVPASNSGDNNSGTCKDSEIKIDDKCVKKGVVCSDYNDMGDRVCNNSKDSLQCDWDNSHKACFAALPKSDNKPNPEPTMSMEEAKNLMLNAPETQELMAYKTSSNFTSNGTVTMPSGRFDKKKNEATFLFPPAPGEQLSLQQAMNRAPQPLMLNSPSEPTNSDSSGSSVFFESRYARADMMWKYSSFSTWGQNLVHEADSQSDVSATVLGYRADIFSSRVSASLDVGPTPADRSDDWYSWRARVDLLGKTVYFKSDAKPVSFDVDIVAPSFLPERLVLFTTPKWYFSVMGLPMYAQLLPLGEYGIKDIKLFTSRTAYTLSLLAKPFAGIVASLQVGPALNDLNDWARKLGGVLDSAKAYLAIDLAVLRQTLALSATIGMKTPDALPLKAYMCRNINYDSLTSLDGRVYAFASVGIFTKVIQTYTKTVCDIFGNCLGFGDKVQELVEKYTTVKYDHTFFDWDGTKWPQSKKPIDQACTEYKVVK